MARAIERRSLLAGGLAWAALQPAFAAKVVVCRDENDKRLFTDKAASCVPSDDPRRVAAAMEKPGAVNFRTPPRRYQGVPGNFQVLVESEMARKEPALTAQATRKLQQVLADVVARLPAPAQQQMKALRYHLMWGENSPQGGLKNGMRYVRAGETSNNPLFDPAWEDSIVINSTTNWMYLDELWSRKALVREMAHAWYVAQGRARQAEVVGAWRAAQDAGLYANATHRSGKPVDKPYAVVHQVAYFAELSAFYFVGGEYTPFDREGLKRLDTRGYQLVESFWGVGKP